MFLRKNDELVFPLGMYDRPRSPEEWEAWRKAGINLVHCGNRENLDEAREHGMFGWITVPMVLADGDDGSALAAKVDELKDHPALAVWEAPDEAIWNGWYDDRIPRRLWTDSPEDVAAKNRKMDAIVRGMERGAAVVRKHDPSRKIWLNEAVLSPLDVLARCAAALDVIGFDIYPAGVDEDNFARPQQIMGKDIDRFRAAAPGKEFWMVEQAFSYPELSPMFSGLPGGYPPKEQIRFMAWQAILHGSTGLLWYGSTSVKRPSAFLDELMSVIAEIDSVQEFLPYGPHPEVTARAHETWRPSIMGCSCEVRRKGDRALVLMINEDGHSVDMFISGLAEALPGDLRPINTPSADLTPLDGGFITPMKGYETRLYVAG